MEVFGKGEDESLRESQAERLKYYKQGEFF